MLRYLKRKKTRKKRGAREAAEKQVIVYQMGKVASTSLVKTLNSVSGVEAHQSHFLGLKTLESIVGMLVDPSRDPHFIEHGEGQLIANLELTRMVESYRAGLRGDGKIYILSLARDPLDWFYSQVVQEMEGYLPGLRLLAEERAGGGLEDSEAVVKGLEYVRDVMSELFGDALKRGVVPGEPDLTGKVRSTLRGADGGKAGPASPILLEHISAFLRPFGWFDTHILSNFGIDVLKADYGERPWHAFSGDYFELILLKYESLSQAPGILGEWLGVEVPELVRENISRKKPLQKEVKDTVAAFKDDGKIMEAVASSRYCKSFGYYRDLSVDRA